MKVPKPRKLPSGNYYIQMLLGGVSVSVTRPTAKECTREAELIKAKHRAEHKLASASTITVTNAIDKYIDSKSAVLSVETIRGYRVIQRNRFKPYMNRSLASVNWQRAVNDEAKIVSAKSVANAWGLISSVLKDNGLNVPRITLPQIVRNEHEWLTAEQIPIFLAALEGDRCELPALLALNGLRRSEIYALNRDSFKDGKILVRGAKVMDADGNIVFKKENKNTSSRRDVPIVIPRITELLESGTELFECPMSYLTKSINRVCSSAGLPEVGTHGLRHSFASLCFHRGLSQVTVQKLGGWSSPDTLRKIYTHTFQKELDDESAKVREFFKNS